jgi:hypothetical protein
MYFQSKDQKVKIVYHTQDRYNFTWSLFVEGKFKKNQGVAKGSKKVVEAFGYQQKDFELRVT